MRREEETMISYYYELDASKSFENDYNVFLEKVEENKATYKDSEGSYIDPDCVGDVGKTEFYNHLTCFLNHQEREYKEYEKRYRFLPPSEAPRTTPKEKDNECIDKKKITVIPNDENEKPFRLTSDQFGFSAKETIYNSNQYPLANLLRLSQNKGSKEREKVKERITRYVINTRTIGGSFLWPVYPQGQYYCNYNIVRGRWLEDRVDLTLLEIKHALDRSYDKGEHTSDILYKQYQNEKRHMKTWLDHFETFDEYVKYFMLEPFVKDGMPINIINDKPLDDDYIKNYKEQYKRWHLQNLTAEEICGVLVRLEIKILKRSENMEKVIKQYI